MSRFYLNVARKGNEILVRECVEGSIVKRRETFSPKLYIESNDGDHNGFYGERLKEIEFHSISDAREFCQKHSTIDNFKIHGNTDYVVQYVAERYPGKIEYDSSKIRVGIIDIEIAVEDRFPEPEQAAYPINLIVIYDSIEEKFFCWGLGDWYVKDTVLDFVNYDNVIYNACVNEKELLTKFINHVHASTYDVISGYNINNFDIPYIVNRSKMIVGSTAVKRLSPWGYVKEKVNKGKFGKENQNYDLIGTAVLDYMELYKYYSYSTLDSYTLDNVCESELGEKKLDYSEQGTIYTLYKNNFQRFVDYCIKDVELIRKLDRKKSFFELVFSISYYSKIQFQEIFGTVKTWDTIIYNHLIEKGVVVPSKNENNTKRSFGGGYVKEPKNDFYNWVVSVDLNSLYPSLIQQYNISPETLIEDDDLFQFRKDLVVTDVVDESLVEKRIDLTGLKSYNKTMTANGTFFRRDQKGIFPTLMAELYKIRKDDKKRMLYWEAELESVKHEMGIRGL